MFARRTTVALSALALSGCWPVIPGKADDYVLPETALITGSFGIVDAIGGYWDGDGAPAGSASFGILATPQTVTDGLAAWGVADTCVRNYESPALEGGFRSGGSGTAALVHNGAEVRLPWVSSALQWAGPLVEADWETDTDYDLAAIQVAGMGALEIPGLFKTPDAFIVTGPAMGGEDMGTVAGPEALTITWDSEGKAEWVLITAFAVSESSGGVTEYVSCLVDDNGSFTIPPELWENVASTSYVAIQVGALTVTGGTTKIGEEEHGYVTSSTWLIQGAVAYGGTP